MPICIDVRRLSMIAPGLMEPTLLTLCSVLGNSIGSLIPEWSTPIVPVTGLVTDEQYEVTLRTIIGRELAGLCLRLSDKDIRRTTLRGDIDQFLERMGCVPNDIYVVVDFKYIDENHLPSLAEICSGTFFLLVCGFSALRAEKPHTDDRNVPCCRGQNRLQTPATA